MYAKKSGQNVDDIVFYFALVCLNSGTVQQHFTVTTKGTPKTRFQHLDSSCSYLTNAQQVILPDQFYF